MKVDNKLLLAPLYGLCPRNQIMVPYSYITESAMNGYTLSIAWGQSYKLLVSLELETTPLLDFDPFLLPPSPPLSCNFWILNAEYAPDFMLVTTEILSLILRLF